jgi:hypothetical protein
MGIDQLVAAFAAMSGSNSPPPAAHPAQMEELAAAFATSLTMSGHDNPVQEMTSTGAAQDDGRQPTEVEEACVLRVRFPDGQVVCQSFGAGRPTTELYQYCSSVLLAGGAAARGMASFRLVRLAGGASEEVRVSPSASFRDLGLHYCTLHVVPD